MVFLPRPDWLDRLVGIPGLNDGLNDRADALNLENRLGKVVVGCSGGADSLALLAVSVSIGLDVVAVHVDHGLRPESARETDVVELRAGDLGVTVDLRQVEVGLGPNLEARARTARYRALSDAADEHGAPNIFVGHTADDQAETVLLALLRGSAMSGLAGMPVQRGPIIRPLLQVRRSETEAYCAKLGWDPVRDPSNDDRAYRRAWIRHEALPLLSQGAERDLVPILARQAEVLRVESEFLDQAARALWPSGDDTSAQNLIAAPLALARRAVRCWLGLPPPSFEEVERVLAVARGEATATEISGGRRVWRSAGQMLAEARH